MSMKVLVIDQSQTDSFFICEEKSVAIEATKYFNNEMRRDPKSCPIDEEDFIFLCGPFNTDTCSGGRFQIFELGDELIYKPFLVSRTISEANNE